MEISSIFCFLLFKQILLQGEKLTNTYLKAEYWLGISEFILIKHQPETANVRKTFLLIFKDKNPTFCARINICAVSAETKKSGYLNPLIDTRKQYLH